MTEFVSRTINDLETVINILKKLELNDTAGLSKADALLSDAQHSLRCKLNQKVMEDYAIAAFIKNLETTLYN